MRRRFSASAASSAPCMREQRLVGGDDVLAVRAAPPATSSRADAARAADQLDDDVDVGVVGQRHAGRRPSARRRGRRRASRPAVARADGGRPRAAGRRAAPAARPCSRSSLSDAGADGAEAGDADPERRVMAAIRQVRRRELRRDVVADAAQVVDGAPAGSTADVAHRLADAVLVLDQGDADMAVAILAEADARATPRPWPPSAAAWRSASEPSSAKRLGHRRPGEHRGVGAGTSQPAAARPSISTSRRSL